MEGRRKGGREGRRKGGREGGKEEGREGGREGGDHKSRNKSTDKTTTVNQYCGYILPMLSKAYPNLDISHTQKSLSKQPQHQMSNIYCMIQVHMCMYTHMYSTTHVQVYNLSLVARLASIHERTHTCTHVAHKRLAVCTHVQLHQGTALLHRRLNGFEG